MDGKVIFDSKKDKFYIEEKSTKLEFNLVAEGIRKDSFLNMATYQKWSLEKRFSIILG